MKWRLVFTVVSLLTGVALAQEYRGRVQGIVTDPSQAAVVGAKATLKNVNTGIESVEQTNSMGQYTFDHVIPGSYSLAVEAAGFQKFVQPDITVMTRGDVTVNAALTVGAVTDTITVSGGVAEVQFNTSTMITEVVGQQLRDLPVMARNPFTLAVLNPAVVNTYWDMDHRNPFYMWSSTGFDVGGSTSSLLEEDMDGTTLNVSGGRGSYAPAMDAVQEVAVLQNPVDAESGFSAGGTLSVSTKSGTNDWHGSAYYFGRNPVTNALANRITRDENIIRQNIWGGTVGNAIKKSKLFNFFSYEQWVATQPTSKVQTVPTPDERNGDFSRALTPQGDLRTIYDPFTTVFNPTTSSATRMPFPGNIVPQNRMDPAGKKALADLWLPNNAGDDLSGVNNFKKVYPWWTHYWNMTDRVDYNISDKFRMYARFSKYQTRLDNVNWGGTIAVPSDNGGVMDALNAMIDVLYVASPKTTIDFRFGSTYVEDDYASDWAKVPESEWASFWPNGWYKPVLSVVPAIYYPNFNFTGNGSAYTGMGGGWQVHGRSHNPTVTVAHDKGIHHLKAGWQLRYSYDQNVQYPWKAGSFTFNSIDTGSSFLGYNATQSGDMYASALLGTLNSGYGLIPPPLDMHQEQWALYLQDDIKLNRNITLNLGLRWEYETAPAEETRQLNRYLDLNASLPALANNPPVMPPQVTSIAQIPYKWNGALLFTDNSHPRMYDATQRIFLPRAGIAIRINDKTAFRAGWARFAVPVNMLHDETDSLPIYGFGQTTNVLGPLQGTPRTLLSNPFPSTNPLQVPAGTSYGAYTEVGNDVGWWNPKVRNPKNDRINFTLQRQTFGGFFTEATFFTNLSRDISTTFNVNQMDPNLAFTYKGAVDQSVPNPFYKLLPTNEMPGSLGTQPTVSVSQLLTPYPQYGALTEYGWPGVNGHYYALQLKAERKMANGVFFLVAYNHNHQTQGTYFNQEDTYNNHPTMMDIGNPREHLRLAGTWELPFGKGREFLSSANKVVDTILGGWSTSHLWMFNSGSLLTFGQAYVTCDPRGNVASGLYFNPTCFQIAQPYTLRTNPLYYSGLRGPYFWSLDSTLTKNFPITERVKLELRMEFYNLPNTFMPSNPDTGIGSGTMGRSTWVQTGNYGRELQYTARIHF